MAAASISTGMDINLSTGHHSEAKLHFSYTTSLVRIPSKKRLNIFCNSTKSSPNFTEPRKKQQRKHAPSLSDQLKPLSTTFLAAPKDGRTHDLSRNPKSTWVNPTKPRRSVLSLQRQKRSPHTENPQFRDLKLFVAKLCECGDSDSAFLAVLEESSHLLSRENVLFILRGLKPWEKAHKFLKWVKSQNSFPMETIFYNVAMKNLRNGRQFKLVEELAREMIADEIELDNITYSTIITCAKRCNLFDKAVEWFERMYNTGLMPDEVTYSAVLDVYAKLGKVEEVVAFYERGRASGWKPDPIAFSVLGKMFGEARDCDGIKYVLQEMKSLELQPNLVVYNTLLEAMGKAGKPGMAKALFREMIDVGINPNERTLTALVKMYGKARWARDALELWEQMKSSKWPMDMILYNTLLSMCAEIGLEKEAEELFEEMKCSEQCRPDSWSYTAMLNMYGSGGKAEKAMELFEEMSKLGVELDIMGCTCLIQCLGRANRIVDLINVFHAFFERGNQPDDKLCGCLLSVVAFCDEAENANKVLACLQQTNPKLVAFINLLEEEKTSLETIKEEFKAILGETSIQSRRPFCNCLIDMCRNRGLHERASQLLYFGSLYGLYPDLHNKTEDEWCLNVRSLSIGAAYTAFEEWIGTLSRVIEHQEKLPETFCARTGAGSHKSSQGVANALASHVEKLAAPFRRREENAGCLVASREDLVSWIQSRNVAPPTVPV